MADPFIGEIRAFPYNFAPRNWLFCEGQLLPIAQHTALFSLLGTTYGGDGRTTFGVPDLRGRAAIGEGRGPGLTQRNLGEEGGSDTVALSVNQLPRHNHTVRCTTDAADRYPPVGAFPAAADRKLYGPASPNGPMHSGALNEAGAGGGHENRQPYLAISWCIALTGVFPSRN